MRAAIISQLKTISDFSNRVYQAFIPITTVETPYCTVKLSGEYPVVGNRKGSTIDLQNVITIVEIVLHSLTLGNGRKARITQYNTLYR